MRKVWNFKVVNAGQSGDTSAGGLNRLDWLLKNRVDILILELGANDGLRGLPPETTKKIFKRSLIVPKVSIRKPK